MPALPPPPNFRVTNRDTSPFRKVRMDWSDYTPLQKAGLSIQGWRIHRSTSPGFTASGAVAGSGTCIADESTIPGNVFFYEDGNVPAYGVYYYEIQAVGGFGYGLGPYGDGTPYGSPS